MSDRRAFLSAGFIGCWLWLAGVASWPVVVPSDSQHAAMAQEPAPPQPPPTPQPEPQPAPEITAEIIAPDLAEPGTFVNVGLKTNGTKINVRWLFNGKDDPAHFRPVNQRAAIITAASGAHVISVYGVIDETPVLAVREIQFGEPAPPEPPRPIAELITGEHAAKLATLYRAMAVVPPPDDFWAAHASLVEERGIVLSADALKALHARLDALVADAPALQAELAKIAGELGEEPAPPPTPPVVEGKRRIVILHESGDDDPAQARLYVQLRGSAVAPYLASKGHKLDILDATDNPLANGLTLPAMLILDASTGVKIATLPLPASTAAFLEAVKSNGG